MIRRLSLSQRLALVVVSLLILCAAAVCVVQLHSSAQYGNAMVQRLSAGLAQQIVAREPLLDAHGGVNRQTLKSLFDRLMTFNPSVELYLLSPDGDLLATLAEANCLVIVPAATEEVRTGEIVDVAFLAQRG